MLRADANYSAKIAARANGTTPVLVQQVDPAAIKGGTPEAVEARYRAKIEARARGAAKPGAAEQPKADTETEKEPVTPVRPEPEAPHAEPEQPRQHPRDNERGGRHR